MWHPLIILLFFFIFLHFSSCIDDDGYFDTEKEMPNVNCKKTEDIKDFNGMEPYKKKELKSIIGLKVAIKGCRDLCLEDEQCEGFLMENFVCYFCGYSSNPESMCPIYNFAGKSTFGEELDDAQFCYMKCHKNRIYPNYVPAKTLINIQTDGSGGYNYGAGEQEQVSCNNGYYVAGTDGDTKREVICLNLRHYIEISHLKFERQYEMRCVEKNVCPFFHASQWCFFLTICLGFVQYWPA